MSDEIKNPNTEDEEYQPDLMTLEDEDGNFMVRKHTIDMPPGSKRSYRVTADALGRWAYHCHLMYHMEMGMFREVRVDE